MADFFEQQDRARRSTTRLVVLFGLAVLAIMASIELLLAATMGYLGRDDATGAIDWAGATDPQLLLVAVAGTAIIVGGGSLFKMAQLRAGGRVVAEELGGRLLSPDTTDTTERRLLNVVEEMAIASGTPTPPVYLMDAEEGINAFAAGFSPEDAVIGVTRGTATRLSRDELQGVIAHEFSHILNGDMRLNIRLIGLLHGILIIGMIGYFVLRMSIYSGAGRRRSRDGNNALPIIAIGAGLTVIGFTGTFFGNLIKAAVSRQREFLADASAVQFTRHPDGIAGALRKIGGFAAGSSVQNPNAPEASHMFFGRATSGFSAMFSTHPPLAERIRRIDPSWDGEFPEAVPTVDPADGGRAAAAGAAGFAGGGPAASPGPAPRGRTTPMDGAVESVGQPSESHIRYAASLIESLPTQLVAAAREPYGARAVIYALLLDARPAMRQAQLAHLDEAADRGVFAETTRLAPAVDGLDARLRLPLLEIALPALRALTPTQYRTFRENVAALVEADQRIELFEWAMYRILLRDLDAHYGRPRTPRVRHHSIDAVRPAAELLLSVLAYVGHRDADGAAAAFEQARGTLDASGLRLLRPEDCGLAALDAALVRLDEAAPKVKRRVLEAAVASIAADDRVTATEAELLRAVSASMSCPMPPIDLR
jgi:Zn-dependent protease with chaperone function